MTRQEHLRFCKICKNQKFDPQMGIICGLTEKIADFESECSNFETDQELQKEVIFVNEKLLDNSKRASLAIKIFGGICMVNFLAVVSGYFEFELLERIRLGEYFTEEEADMNDLRQGIIGLAQFTLYLASIITFLNWFRRAYGNLHRINIRLNHAESMAVWSFLIPFISLYRPYQIAREIAHEARKKISEYEGRKISSGASPMLGLWWTLFIITNWVGQFAFKSFLKDDTIEQMTTSTQAYMFSDFIDIPAAIVTLLMIKKISKDESKLFEMNTKYD